MKKILTFFLALLTLLSVALGSVGCKKDPAQDEITGTTSQGLTDPNDPDADLFADLPQKNFAEDGQPVEFSIMNLDVGWSTVYHMTSDDITTAIDSAIFSRNSLLEEVLGIAIQETVLNNSATILTQLQNLHLSHTYTYDICYSSAKEQNNAVQYGIYAPVSDYDSYINLSKPWWYEDERLAFTFNDVCYLLQGDLNLVRNDAMWTVAFNRDILKQYELETPYDLIAKNEWTWEQMYLLGANTYEEGSGKYVVTSHFNVCTAMVVGAGLRLVVKGEDGLLVRADITDYFLKVIEDLEGYFFVDNGIGKRNGIKTDYESNSFKSGAFGPQTTSFYHVSPFTAGNATFMMTPMGEMVMQLISSGINYGLAPMPKYSSEQTYYNSLVYNGVSFMGVPAEVGDVDGRLERVGTVLEWMNAYSYDLLRPVYYEHVLYGRLSQEEQAVEALDIILGFDERGRTVLEYDQLFKLGMYQTLAITMSDCLPSFANRIRTVKELIDDNISKTMQAYQ